MKFPKKKIFKSKENLRRYAENNPICQLCGSYGIQVHHITFRSSGGGDEDDNLISLCYDCHNKKAHGTESREYRETFFKIKGNNAVRG